MLNDFGLDGPAKLKDELEQAQNEQWSKPFAITRAITQPARDVVDFARALETSGAGFKIAAEGISASERSRIKVEVSRNRKLF